MAASWWDILGHTPPGAAPPEPPAPLDIDLDEEPLPARMLSPGAAERVAPPPPPPAFGLSRATGIDAGRRWSPDFGLSHATGIESTYDKTYARAHPMAMPGDEANTPPLLRIANRAGAVDPLALGQEAGYGAADLPLMVGKVPKGILDPSIPVEEALDSLRRVVRGYPEITEALLAERSPSAVRDFTHGTGKIARGMLPSGDADLFRAAPWLRARLAHFFEEGKAAPLQADWSPFTGERLLPAFDNDVDLAKRFAGLWGAASQGTGVGQDTGEAVAAWHHLLKHGRLPTWEEAMHLGGEHTISKIGLAEAKLPNMQNVIEGRSLEGPKIKDMGAFTEGRTASPLDRHIIHAMGGNTETMGPQYAELRQLVSKIENVKLPADNKKLISSPWGPVSGNEYAYRRVTEMLQRELRKLAPEMEHNPIFSTTWEGVREAKGLPAYGGPGDIFARKGLDQPGAMLNLDTLEKALRGYGGPWTQRLVLALLAAAGSSLVSPQESAAAEPGARAPGGPPAPGPALDSSLSPL